MITYLAIKLPNFKSVDEKLPKYSRVSHSFVIKIHVVSRKKLKVVRNSFPFSIPAELYERLARF